MAAKLSSVPQVVTILDWDDTLFCTTFVEHLSRETYPDIPDFAVSLLQGIERESYRLLSQSLSCGYVYIVTNADAEWFWNSAAKYLPRLLPLLARLTVISARDKFEKLYPADPGRWKLVSFFDLTYHKDLQSIDQLIVIGDSDYEMAAANAVGALFSKVQVKTVKLKEKPTACHLLWQLQELSDAFPGIAALNTRVSVNLGQYLDDGVVL